MNKEILTQELNLFNSLRQKLKTQDDIIVDDLDEYSFVVKMKNESIYADVDVLFCALTHGNEVIGLQIVNFILNDIVEGKLKVSCRIGFMLNNVSAYNQNKRFCSQDLNRSFMSNTKIEKNNELNRAQDIQNLILRIKPKVIVDLHQTIEPTHSSFFVIPESLELISLCHSVNPLWPILCFDSQGFSSEGRTLLEFAFHFQIKCIVIEVSQNGFDQVKATELSKLMQRKLIQNSIHLTTSQSKQHQSYYLIMQKLVKNAMQNVQYKMKRKFINLDKVEKGECIAESNLGDKIISCHSGVILFPKSDDRIDEYQDVGLIAQLVEKV